MNTKSNQTTNPSTVENIKLSSIVPSKNNPRKVFDKEYIKELSESLQGPAGLLSPITVRPMVTGDKFEIVAGECRYRAAKLLKWDSIPAMVKVISDEDLLEVMIIENLNRQDISPLEEASAFKTLLQKENIDWLSTKIHKPKKYISDRLKLNELCDEAAAYLKTGVLPLGHAVMISKLPFAEQMLSLKECIRQDHSSDENEKHHCVKTIDQLKQHIEYNYMLYFDKAPFNLDDETLDVSAGACASCPKRTCNANLLFHDITDEDKCSDPTCFNRKISLHIDRERSKLKEQHGSVLSGERNWMVGDKHIKVSGVNVPIQKTPGKNSIPVVITKDMTGNAKNLGTTVYISKTSLEQAKEEKQKVKTDEPSRNNYKDNQRKEFTATIWPRLQQIALVKDIKPEVVKEFFRDEFDNYYKRKNVLSLAGILGYNEFNTPETAFAEFNDGEEIQFDFKKSMFDKIIDAFTPGTLIIILYLLDRIGDDDDYEIDEGEFGMTWKHIMISLGLEKPEPVKTKRSKK